MRDPNLDLVVIGGGLVGLATAYQISIRYPDLSIAVIEKEGEVAQHQSGHNSGVIHSGIYYKPGSLKAKNCIEGRKLLVDFCSEHKVPFKMCGKVIVATKDDEVPRLKSIFERGVQNSISCSLLNSSDLKEIEPHCAGVAAIRVNDAGVVDFPGVAKKLAEMITARGGRVLCNSPAKSISRDGSRISIITPNSEIQCRYLINAAGLYSDKIAQMYGFVSPYRIVPFRGEYYKLDPARDYLCKSLIYPVPNPEFPFLGVHFTRGVFNDVECGPNAVLALAREGYSWRDVNLSELKDALLDCGVISFFLRHWREGFSEVLRSVSKKRFLLALQRLVPEVQENDLTKGPRGVRAQAMIGGKLHDDFAWLEDEVSVHVLNAPSPAATSCLSIGSEIAHRLAQRFH